MKEIIVDTFLDSIKLLPFLFLAFLIIELIEHKLSEKTTKAIAKSNKFGPLVGSLLGGFPQCGFSVVATNLYITRIISLGTLISIYLSTSDEMLPILISHNADIKIIFSILGIKIIVGMLCGFIIDLIYRRKESAHFDLCDDDHCDCEDSILKSSFIHTLKTLSFIMVVLLVLNSIMYYLPEETISNMFLKNTTFAPILSSLIGLIPSCASSVIITEFYLNDVITFGTCIAGLLTNSGLSILVLFKTNKNNKENLLILTLVYLIGIIAGIIINLLAFL
ncbi:MAG: arsenic efflux protein [Erysipelotrichales bacterium]|nr:arsenic efflux protein [Erysipelotrichales bacterium]